MWFNPHEVFKCNNYLVNITTDFKINITFLEISVNSQPSSIKSVDVHCLRDSHCIIQKPLGRPLTAHSKQISSPLTSTLSHIDYGLRSLNHVWGKTFEQVLTLSLERKGWDLFGVNLNAFLQLRLNGISFSEAIVVHY